MTPLILEALTFALAVATFRGVPFVAWVVASRQTSGRTKVIAALGFLFALIVLALGGIDVDELTIRAPIALIYYGLIGVLLFEIRPIAGRALGRMALVVFVLGSYLIAPALLAPSVPLSATLAVGWEMAFAAYSMACSAPADLRRSDALFFLLVDPSIVFSQRARPVVSPIRARLMRGASRTLLGLGFLVTQTLLFTLLQRVVYGSHWSWMHNGMSAYLRLLILCLGGAFLVFLAHAGLAHVQIGYLRMGGFFVRERYDRPYLASSPADFWRRWNVWLGAWARIYVFVPLSKRLGKRFRRRRTLCTAAAVIGTFVVMGVAHDAIPYLLALGGTGAPQGTFLMTAFFSATAIVVLAWDGAARLDSRLRISARLSRRLRMAVGRVAFIHVLAAFAWLAVPIVMHRVLPQPVEDLLRAIDWW